MLASNLTGLYFCPKFINSWATSPQVHTWASWAGVFPAEELVDLSKAAVTLSEELKPGFFPVIECQLVSGSWRAHESMGSSFQGPPALSWGLKGALKGHPFVVMHHLYARCFLDAFYQLVSRSVYSEWVIAF